MTHIWAIILGVVQGLAEFLPVSSTAHLKLIPWLFGVSDPMLKDSACRGVQTHGPGCR